jgi:glutaredoxin
MGRYHPKRLLFAAIVLLIIYVHIRHSRTDEFYSKTVKALNKKSKDKAWKAEIDAKVQQILIDKDSPQLASSHSKAQTGAAAAVTHESTPRLPPNPPSPSTQPQDDNNDKIPPGQKRLPAQKPKYLKETPSSPLPTKPSSSSSAPPPDHLALVRATLDEIIHHHSIVIFSKTYCPHSRRAKTLLLETYDILPKPYIVELDTWTEPAGETNPTPNPDGEPSSIPSMGKALQDLLAQRTGRRTVPNILVLGMSIGGADEIVKLHEEGGLADKLRGMVGKRLEKCEEKKKVVAS